MMLNYPFHSIFRTPNWQREQRVIQSSTVSSFIRYLVRFVFPHGSADHMMLFVWVRLKVSSNANNYWNWQNYLISYHLPPGNAYVTHSVKKKHGKSPFLCRRLQATVLRISLAKSGQVWGGRRFLLCDVTLAVSKSVTTSSRWDCRAMCNSVWPFWNLLPSPSKEASSTVNCRATSPPQARYASTAILSPSQIPIQAFNHNQSSSENLSCNLCRLSTFLPALYEVTLAAAPLGELGGEFWLAELRLGDKLRSLRLGLRDVAHIIHFVDLGQLS